MRRSLMIFAISVLPERGSARQVHQLLSISLVVCTNQDMWLYSDKHAAGAPLRGAQDSPGRSRCGRYRREQGHEGGVRGVRPVRSIMVAKSG